MSEQPPRSEGSNPPSGAPPEGGAPGFRPPGSDSAFMVMVLHLFTFLCCANWFFGPLGIVFAVRATMTRERGGYEQADTLVRYSWMCLGAGLVMLIVMVLLTMLMLALGVPFLQDRSGFVPY